MQKGLKYLRHQAKAYLGKYLSVILIFIFLSDLGGYHLWFYVWQNNNRKEIRKEIRMGLKEEDLSLIIVSIREESGISWIEPGKEFSYQGEMYDVVKIKIKNQEKYYYCIRDSKEKQLIANYNKNDRSGKEAAKIIRKFNYQYIAEKNLPADPAYPLDIAIPEISVFYASNIIEIKSPPPKML